MDAFGKEQELKTSLGVREDRPGEGIYRQRYFKWGGKSSGEQVSRGGALHNSESETSGFLPNPVESH